MATVHITEGYAGADAAMQAMPLPRVAAQVMNIGVDLISNPFSENVRLIRVHAKGLCMVGVGVADIPMAVRQTEYFNVHPGQQLLVVTDI